MSENSFQNIITLYPSNWLYNAGVIGLLKVLDELGKKISFPSDGSISLSFTEEDAEKIFRKWDELSPKSKSKKGTSLIYGWKKAYYANQTENSIKKRINFLCRLNNTDKGKVEFSCSFCTDRVKIKSNATFLNQAFGNVLLGSARSFCNMYWNNSARDYVCPRCEFILMCHHLAFTRLSDGSEIFINTPSFQVMYNLNKFAREVFGALSPEAMRNKRNILAMSLIEYSTRIQVTLGVWTGMNIEIVNKHTFYNPTTKKQETKIEFFSLPFEVIQLLSDRRIAGLLSQIGEFSILNFVLDQDFSRLIELGYRLLRIGLKPYSERGDSENKFVNQILHLDKNHSNPSRVAEQIFKLYALIEEKIKRRRGYEYLNYSGS